MIEFQSISVKNFLSVGNKPIEINFTDQAALVITGKNGTGKSTIVTALIYALYGRSDRKINISQLVNSINKKNTLVELNFKIGSTQYLVRRGIKPAIFEVHVDDCLREPDASIKEYQLWFETNVLKMNIKTFRQIVVLGSSSFVPFMELSSTDRRSVVEDVLDIKIFSSMNIILKLKAVDLKNRLANNNQSEMAQQTAVDLIRNHLMEFKVHSDTIVADYQSEISQLEADIRRYDTQVSELDGRIASLQEDMDDHLDLTAKQVKLGSYIATIGHQIANLSNRISFLDSADACPKCHQTIDPQFKSVEIDNIQKILHKTQAGQLKLRGVQSQVAESISANDIHQEMICKYQRDIVKYDASRHNAQNQIDSIGERLSSMIASADVESKELLLADAQSELDFTVKTKSTLLVEGQYLGYATQLLRDDGIKKQIINQYLPIFNALLRKYFTLLEFDCKFEFDDEFNETIKSRFRDKFSYASFSEGQKMRINLAILFTMRDIASLKNSTVCNMLIVDELTGTLDDAGVDAFRGIVMDYIGASAINRSLIITHDPRIKDSFDASVETVIENNFTKLCVD